MISKSSKSTNLVFSFIRKNRLIFFAILMHISMAASMADFQSLREFDARAREGGEFNIVFFGGSLTYGANASDPLTTSYRGRMMQYLLDRYPKASLRFHDAAIGGTGSDLGLFRLERDVLSKKPDLVFLDFTVNDAAEAEDPQRLASYEYLMRKILESGSALLPVLMVFEFHTEHPDDPLPPRHRDHIKIAEAYSCPPANVLSGVRRTVQSGSVQPKALWPFDAAHPDDAGYAVFFEIIRDAFEQALASNTKPRLPENPVFPAIYQEIERRPLEGMQLPPGWEQAPTRRTSLWFDALSSRWMGPVASARVRDGKTPEPLEVSFRGSLVGLFGERDSITVPFRVKIDGKPVSQPNSHSKDPTLWKIDTSAFGPVAPGAGNLFAWIPIANDLADGNHILRIEPIFEGSHADSELRIESVCSAGR